MENPTDRELLVYIVNWSHSDDCKWARWEPECPTVYYQKRSHCDPMGDEGVGRGGCRACIAKHFRLDVDAQMTKTEEEADEKALKNVVMLKEQGRNRYAD